LTYPTPIIEGGRPLPRIAAHGYDYKRFSILFVEVHVASFIKKLPVGTGAHYCLTLPLLFITIQQHYSELQQWKSWIQQCNNSKTEHYKTMCLKTAQISYSSKLRKYVKTKRHNTIGKDNCQYVLVFLVYCNDSGYILA